MNSRLSININRSVWVCDKLCHIKHFCLITSYGFEFSSLYLLLTSEVNTSFAVLTEAGGVCSSN
jgi:hypothetical protein